MGSSGFVDVHEVCSRGGIDWQKVAERAEWLGYGEVLQLTLGVCRALLGTSTPLDSSLKPLPPWIRLFPDSSPLTPWKEVLLTARLLKSPSARVGYLAHLLSVPTLADHQLLRLPLPWLPLVPAPSAAGMQLRLVGDPDWTAKAGPPPVRVHSRRWPGW